MKSRPIIVFLFVFLSLFYKRNVYKNLQNMKIIQKYKKNNNNNTKTIFFYKKLKLLLLFFKSLQHYKVSFGEMCYDQKALDMYTISKSLLNLSKLDWTYSPCC